MTTYSENIEKTVQEATPELYAFQIGDIIERYTSFANDVIMGGYEYKKAPIKRSGFSLEAKTGSIKLSVTVPVTTAFKQQITSQSFEPLKLTIYKTLESDPEQFVILFSGSVKQISIKNLAATAYFEAGKNALQIRLPNIVYQSYCNHALFDRGCGLLTVNWKTSAIVSAVTGSQITSPAFSSFANDYFTQGYLETIHGDMRWITKHTGNICWIHAPFDDSLQINSVLNTYPGCNGSPDTCKNKFGNFDNFLGFPYIPSHNPVIFGFK